MLYMMIYEERGEHKERNIDKVVYCYKKDFKKGCKKGCKKEISHLLKIISKST